MLSFLLISLAVKEIKILSGERTSYYWKHGGLKMDVPSDSLPEDVAECTLQVTASLDTNMSLPNDTALVSGVYHIMPPSNVLEFKKPVPKQKVLVCFGTLI